ncbi:MAG: GNAT family N-acetyltransferase [Clostridia bacterium]|nr:GNAT family N-acetyltransferase [Clostridia bacterium]
MKKISGNDILKVKYLFEEYKSNLPVIHSVFECQYDGSAYVDDLENLHWAILCTPFMQHFIAGNPTDGCLHILEDILFSCILEEQDEKEIVIFASEKWNDILDEIFKKHNGVTDVRKIFLFSSDNYKEIKHPSLPSDIQPLLEKCRITPFSLIDTWSSKLLSGNQIISHCDALMVGKGMAEIDIATDESFRGKGYATAAAMLLIDKLLEINLTPCWSSWPFRIESQHIAQKLGFIPSPDEKAWIWMEGM